METLNIAWFNWRCIKHPLAGGAEVYTHEVAKRLSEQGHNIVLITSRPPTLPREETISGYRVLRSGNRYTVYLNARRIYHSLKRQGFKPDIVVDEINTIPFLTPLYVSEPILILIHQLCKDCWSYAIHPLVKPIGWWLEKKLHSIYIKNIDKIRNIITVSESTKRDLIQLGYPQEKIHIVPNGLEWSHYRDCHETADKENLVVYIGRITPYKRLEDLIKAWHMIETWGRDDIRLIIAGRPDKRYLEKLRKTSKKLKIKNIDFKINLDINEKKKLLSKAKILVYTSTREGWGQTILEAAACKTPAIAYNVPGLRDAVVHMKTGVLVEPNNVMQLAQAIIDLINNEDVRVRLGNEAYRVTQKFTWESTASRILKYVM